VESAFWGIATILDGAISGKAALKTKGSRHSAGDRHDARGQDRSERRAPAVNGLMEKRGGALTDMDRARLQERMKAYFDASMDWASFKSQGSPLGQSAARFVPRRPESG
jgi:hypothetical protein